MSLDAAAIAVRRVRWKAACRIVPTRYPSIYLYDRVAAPEDFDALYALEALTNERLRDETGEIALVPPKDRVFGPGSGPIMASFTHLNPDGSRFSDGRFGVFYAASDRKTAVEETCHHHAAFLRATRQAAAHFPMRLYHVRIDAELHDLRGGGAAFAAVMAPDSYVASRALAAELRAAGSAGVAYGSVRHPPGQCVGLFTPRGARDCLHAAYLLYAWDGARFTDVYEQMR
jgi:hypothetical protein